MLTRDGNRAFTIEAGAGLARDPPRLPSLVELPRAPLSRKRADAPNPARVTELSLPMMPFWTKLANANSTTKSKELCCAKQSGTVPGSPVKPWCT